MSALLGLGVLQGWVTIWHLYGAAFLLGTGEVFADIAGQVLMPAIVPRSELERANGRRFGAEIVTNQFAGPPLGSWLFAAVASSPFLFDAATFGAAALLVSWIRVSPRSHVAPSGEQGRPRIREGIRLLWRNRLIRTLALLGSAMNALWTAGASILGLYALEVLGIEEAAFGLLLTAFGVGYAAGSFTAARAIERLSRSRSLMAAAASEILMFVLFAAWPQPVVGGAGLAVFGYFSALWDVTAVSLRQSVVPDELLGRVNGAYRFIQWGLDADRGVTRWNDRRCVWLAMALDRRGGRVDIGAARRHTAVGVGRCGGVDLTWTWSIPLSRAAWVFVVPSGKP